MVTTENNILKSEGTKPQFSITSLEFKLYLTEQQKVKKQGQGPGGGVVESDSDLGSESFRQGGALQSQASIHQASSHLQSNPTRASLTSSGLSTMGPGKGGGGVGGGGGPHGYNLIQQQRSTLYKRLTLQEEIEKVETFVDCPKEDKGTQCSESIIHDVFLEEAKKKGEKDKEKEKKGKEEDKKEGGEEEKKEEKEGGGDEDVDDGSRGGAEEDDRSDLCSICSTTSGDRDDMSVYSSVGRRRRGYDEESETVSVFNDQPSLRSDMHSMGRGRRGRSVDPLGMYPSQ
jgi:hypothetical protein